MSAELNLRLISTQLTGKLLASYRQVTGKSELEGLKVEIDSDVSD